MWNYLPVMWRRREDQAAGGISSLADAEHFLELGADRLGTSRIVRLQKNCRRMIELSRSSIREGR